MISVGSLLKTIVQFLKSQSLIVGSSKYMDCLYKYGFSVMLFVFGVADFLSFCSAEIVCGNKFNVCLKSALE